MDQPDAVRATFDEAYPRLVATVTAMCGNREQATNAVREAFVAAATHTHDFAEAPRAEVWLRSAALSRLRQRSPRARRRHLRPTARRLRSGHRHVPGQLFDLGQGVAQQHVALVAALAWLEPRTRLVVILHDLVGEPSNEIAQEVESTVREVERQLEDSHAALAGLRPDSDDTQREQHFLVDVGRQVPVPPFDSLGRRGHALSARRVAVGLMSTGMIGAYLVTSPVLSDSGLLQHADVPGASPTSVGANGASPRQTQPEDAAWVVGRRGSYIEDTLHAVARADYHVDAWVGCDFKVIHDSCGIDRTTALVFSDAAGHRSLMSGTVEQVADVGHGWWVVFQGAQGMWAMSAETAQPVPLEVVVGREVAPTAGQVHARCPAPSQAECAIDLRGHTVTPVRGTAGWDWATDTSDGWWAIDAHARTARVQRSDGSWMTTAISRSGHAVLAVDGAYSEMAYYRPAATDPQGGPGSGWQLVITTDHGRRWQVRTLPLRWAKKANQSAGPVVLPAEWITWPLARA